MNAYGIIKLVQIHTDAGVSVAEVKSLVLPKVEPGDFRARLVPSGITVSSSNIAPGGSGEALIWKLRRYRAFRKKVNPLAKQKEQVDRVLAEVPEGHLFRYREGVKRRGPIQVR